MLGTCISDTHAFRESDAGNGAVSRPTAAHHLHRRGRSRMEGRRISRLRYPDAESRQARQQWGAARAVLRAADVYAHARSIDDGPLSLPLRFANTRHPDAEQIWPRNGRAAAA